MATRFTFPIEQAFDSNGDPLPGAKLNFYVTGTTTPQDTYSNNALTIANANPVVADSAGRFGSIFLQEADYAVTLTDANDVEIYTADPVRGPAGAAVASQAEVDARLLTTKYVSPATLAEGTGLQGSSIASATALTLPAIGDYFNVTGTTTITSISTRAAGRVVRLLFAGICQLTHSANLKCLGAVNHTTAADEELLFVSEGAGVWRMENPGYSEGSFTPVVVGSSTAGAHTYTTQVGRYIRIGNLVWITLTVQINAKDAAMAGNFTITGLPYTASTVSGSLTPLAVEHGGVNWSAGYTMGGAIIQSNTALVLIDELGDNVGRQAVVAAAVANGTYISASGFYRIG